MHNAEDLPNISNFMWGYRGIVEFIPNAVPWPEADYGIYLMRLTRDVSFPVLRGERRAATAPKFSVIREREILDDLRPLKSDIEQLEAAIS